MEILFQRGTTVYFGHQFDPDLTNLPIFVLNMVFTVLMTIYSAFISLKNELKDQFE
ncbi:MAG: hypothetical protein IH840_09110 [Candidatus Heimdallarchaeota archaeon]|nr:hypothetical protein [Candidatus Heimdallarchaeota archaeon]